MKLPFTSIGFVAALLFLLSGSGSSFASDPAGVTADQALRQLELGNRRFVGGRLSGATPASIAEARRKVAQGQKPFAVIVGCSDSRVGPEVIFDQKLGDIFVVRTAGEVVDPVGLGSIEYAIARLGAPLVVVLGHERCGAVSAAVAGGKEPGHIGAVLKAIQPAVRATKGRAGDPVENAVRFQALHVAAQLEASGPILKAAVQSGKLKIVVARYDLDSGKVSLLSEARK
ncbi:MAG: carbonic anhydrase [Verrucomicrobiae bacterium]